MRTRVETLVRDLQRAHLEMLFYCTLRTYEDQARMYRNGRSLDEIKVMAEELDKNYQRPDLAEILIGVGPQNGKKIVTWAGPGQSLHNYGYAVDGVPVHAGKLVWGDDDWERELWGNYGALAEAAGLQWAGHWTHHPEMPHIQLPGVDWRELIHA